MQVIYEGRNVGGAKCATRFERGETSEGAECVNTVRDSYWYLGQSGRCCGMWSFGMSGESRDRK